ncbi:hypothetical protein LWC35_04135 [Pseudonocardia kujensis]|nr:hypothetical protein [Pseudonocardia kujensis]
MSFALPTDTRGLELYVSRYAAGERDEFSFALSSKYKLPESLTVSDDVRVPRDRGSLDRKPKLVVVDERDGQRPGVGAAHFVAGSNGISRAVRDKLARMIARAETVRGLAELPALRRRHVIAGERESSDRDRRGLGQPHAPLPERRTPDPPFSVQTSVGHRPSGWFRR